MSGARVSGISLRPAEPMDVEACGRVCFAAFHDIAVRHGFPPDFADAAAATRAIATFIEHPLTFGVVAEQRGQVVGSTFIHDRRPVATIGPVTVDPRVQDVGVGRGMMEAVLSWAREREFPSVRLVQSAYHMRSLALYASLGFDPREPLSCMQGPAVGSGNHAAVRAATADDLPAANGLCERAHGFARVFELDRAVAAGTATVVEGERGLTGYASAVAFWGHAVGETNDDLGALIGAAPAFGGPGFLVPTRNAGLLRWCLSNGLRIVQPMTLMTMGWYQEPRKPYLCSVGF